MKRIVTATLALALCAMMAVAANVKSGLEIGTPTTAFNVRDITGPNEGKTLCYRCQYGSKPVACIFTREMTPEVAKLVKEIDQTVAKNEDKGMRAFVVLLTDNADAGAKKLSAVAKDQGIKHTPLTVFDGEAGPAKYNISKDAAVTVMMWNKSRVQVNEAYDTAKLSDEDVSKLAAATSKILN